MTSPATHLRSVIDSDGAVILDVERSAITRLNSIGGYVWERLERGELVDEIVLELAAVTGTDISVVDQDVRSFVRELIAKHLLND